MEFKQGKNPAVLTVLCNFPPAVKQFLIFSSEVAVRGIPFTLSTQEDVMVPMTGNPSSFVGIDFDAQESTIFFSDTSKDMIFKQKIDGTGKNGFCMFCLFSIIIVRICSVKLGIHFVSRLLY